MCYLRRKGTPGSVMELSPVLKVISLKQSLVLDGIKGMVTSGKDPTKLASSLWKAIKGKLKQWRKTSTAERWCKCNWKRGPSPIPIKQQNLATWVMWLQPCGCRFRVKKWERDCEIYLHSSGKQLRSDGMKEVQNQISLRIRVLPWALMDILLNSKPVWMSSVHPHLSRCFSKYSLNSTRKWEWWHLCWVLALNPSVHSCIIKWGR